MIGMTTTKPATTMRRSVHVHHPRAYRRRVWSAAEAPRAPPRRGRARQASRRSRAVEPPGPRPARLPAGREDESRGLGGVDRVAEDALVEALAARGRVE